MHQNLLNAEFAYVWNLNAKNENVHVIRIIEALTKVLSASADSPRRTQVLLLHMCLPSIAFL
jgi:hypothetical protein